MVIDNGKPLFSVVIPTYNHAHLIARCLGSVIAQTFPSWEAIVVNNYSDDNTIDIVQGLGDMRIRLINFRNNGVIAASRNEGIRHAAGDYIAFLDSDDWWYPDKLEAVRGHIAYADVIYHDLDIFTEKGKKLTRRCRGRRLLEPVFNDLMVNGNALPNSSVVLRKTIIESAGGLSEEKGLVAFEDYDLWLRIARITDKFLYINKRLGGYWFGEINLTKTAQRETKGIESIWERHASFLSSEEKEQAELFKKYQLARVNQRLGRYDDALKLFSPVRKARNWKFRIRALIFIIFISLFHKGR